MLYNAAGEAGRGPANVHYAWWAGRAGDGGRYAEHVAPPAPGEAAATATTADADMALDGTSVAASASPRTPLPGLAQTYGGVGHLQALLAAKADLLVPPGVEGGCWDRMFVVFTGARPRHRPDSPPSVSPLSSPLSHHRHLSMLMPTFPCAHNNNNRPSLPPSKTPLFSLLSPLSLLSLSQRRGTSPRGRSSSCLSAPTPPPAAATPNQGMGSSAGTACPRTDCEEGQ